MRGFLRWSSCHYTEDVDLAAPGVQAYIVAPQPPVVLLAAELVENGEGRRGAQVRGNDHHTLLRGVRIEVHDRDQDLARLGLRVGEDRVFLGVENRPVREPLQRRAVTAEIVQ